MIAWAIYFTFAGAILVLVAPQAASRWIALGTATSGLVVSLIAFFQPGNFGVFQTITDLPWVPTLGSSSAA